MKKNFSDLFIRKYLADQVEIIPSVSISYINDFWEEILSDNQNKLGYLHFMLARLNNLLQKNHIKRMPQIRSHFNSLINFAHCVPLDARFDRDNYKETKESDDENKPLYDLIENIQKTV